MADLPAKLRERVSLRAEAVGARRGRVRFNATGTAAAAVGMGDAEVPVVALDEALVGEEVTFLKMDIAGAEIDALQGAGALIRERRPVLAICAYHLQDHLWRVPLTIREIAPDYRLFLRAHNREGYDLVCYAVPPHRLASLGKIAT